MKYCLCFLLIAVTRLLAGDSEGADRPDVLVRLAKVSYTYHELQSLIATFEPVRIDQMGGGGRGMNTFPPPTLETVIGKEFTVTFIRQAMNAHEQTLWHVIASCGDKPDEHSGRLKLRLILSVPPGAAKTLSSDADRDFSRWVIMSVDAPK